MKIKQFYARARFAKRPAAADDAICPQSEARFVSSGLSVAPHYRDGASKTLTSDCPERAAMQSQADSALVRYRKKIQRLEALDTEVYFDTPLDRS